MTGLLTKHKAGYRIVRTSAYNCYNLLLRIGIVFTVQLLPRSVWKIRRSVVTRPCYTRAHMAMGVDPWVDWGVSPPTFRG